MAGVAGRSRRRMGRFRVVGANCSLPHTCATARIGAASPYQPLRGRAGPVVVRSRAPGRRPARGRVDEGRTVALGFASPANMSRLAGGGSAARLGRMLEPAEWASAGIPLLRNPRGVVVGLHDRHRPGLSTAVVAVLDPRERVTASASFTGPATAPDGWEFRNALLSQLRRIIPHDLRRRVPVRTAVLLYCRAGEPRWTETDGAWLWGLRDACTLHGLRCGAYIMLTADRWQVLGEGRGGRRPRLPSRTDAPRTAEPLTEASPTGTSGDAPYGTAAERTRVPADIPGSGSGPEVPSPAAAWCPPPGRHGVPGTTGPSGAGGTSVCGFPVRAGGAARQVPRDAGQPSEPPWDGNRVAPRLAAAARRYSAAR